MFSTVSSSFFTPGCAPAVSVAVPAIVIGKLLRPFGKKNTCAKVGVVMVVSGGLPNDVTVNGTSLGWGSVWPSVSTASACATTGPPAAGTGTLNVHAVDGLPGPASLAGLGVKAGTHVLVAAFHQLPFIFTATSTRATPLSSLALPLITTVPVLLTTAFRAGLESTVEGRPLAGPPGTNEYRNPLALAT